MPPISDPHRPGRLRRAVAGLALAAALWAVPAAAETPVCAGTDLLAEIAQSEPARHRALLASAKAIENGDAVLWRIRHPRGGKPSWLFGTMHVSDPRVLDLPPAARKALDGARNVALENTNVLDPSAARTAYAEGLAHMIYADGRTLPSVLGPDDWTKASAAMAARGLPGWAVAGWKPWMVVFGVLLYPPCELKRWQGGIDMLDIAIGKRARAAGKPVVDLETVTDQFSAIDAMTEAEQIALLRAMLRVEPKLADMQETTIRLYEAGRIGMLWAAAGALLAPDPGGADFIASVLQNASNRRNAGMVRNARPLIDEGNAFLAVGALHLIGPEGVVALLRKAGYKVEPVR